MKTYLLLAELLEVLEIRLVKVADKLAHLVFVVQLLLELVLVLVVRLVVTLHPERLELLLGVDFALAVQDRLPDVLVNVQRLVAVRARLESGDQLALERLFEPCRRERLGFTRRLSLLRLLLDRDDLRTAGACASALAPVDPPVATRDSRLLHLEFLHPDEVLGDLGETLLALVHQELGPVD